LRDGERAQSAVEFALVLLFVIIPLMAGIIDGGIMFYKYVAITNTAREAAREGAIYQYPCCTFPASYTEVDDARAAIIYQAITTTQGPLVIIGPGEWSVAYDPPVPTVQEGTYPYRPGVKLIVTLTDTHVLFFGFAFGNTIDLKSSATMRIEPGGAELE